MSWEHLTRAAILAVEYFWRDPENARRGQVLIGDAAGFSLAILRKYTIPQYLDALDIFYVSFFL
jgi:hypothetical protein